MNAARDEEPGLSLLVHRPGEEPTLLHTGLASLEHRLPIGPDTTFNVGSVAKQITAHLILLAAHDDLLRLDQQAADLLPRLKISDVTVADLVTHRSGIRDAESLLSLAGFRDLDHYTADDLRTLAYRQHQRAVPEGRFLYSNTNYLLLAEILETVHHTTLPDLARHRVFGPLGMHSTHFQSDPRQVIPAAAAAYQATHDDWQHAAAPVTLPGPGTLWTTVGDLDRWLTHLHQHWQHPHQLPWQEAVDYEPSDHKPYLYGPGLYADARPGRTAVFHYGHEQGFSAAAQAEASGLRVIALSNNAGLSADRVTAAILRDLHQQPTLAPKEALVRATALERTPSTATRDQPTPDDLGQHTELGTFACDQAPGSLRLTRRADALHLWRRGTCDQLTHSGPGLYAGNGYTLTVPSSTDQIDRFTLDLERAPRLAYVRQ
ncbi:serine hydrolase domain-containing protein [Streptomyces antarcticus]|uniref:serine hydrolase domain-containing protein n=1 Tax=Streptomyces antarcticus TaxID=2996458 RepID=UPI00226E9EAE|nr:MULTISPECIES: serine hydrolase domain-containing protein [unclassified Streptomyces]MCY0944236.1 serine hydrolase [Streptomyces sp. H34-AA3]MCZ4086645.1 serine hydrolase [Streptomyces sp. H34-S5]